MSPDIINGCFELFGGLLMWLSIRQIIRDKQIVGFSPAPLIFWTAWGLWNLFYYPSLDQWFSFLGGIVVVVSNAIYLVLIWHFSRRAPRKLPNDAVIWDGTFDPSHNPNDDCCNCPTCR